MIGRLRTMWILVLALAGPAAAVHAAEPVTTRVEGQEVRGYDRDNRLLWRYRVDPSTGPIDAVETPGGVLLRNLGIAIDRSGRRVPGAAPAGSAGPRAAAVASGVEIASWSAPYSIAPPYSSFVTRSDPTGNVVALALMPNGLAVIRSVGASGAWNPPEMVDDTPSSEYLYGEDMAIDLQGNITVVWRTFVRTNYEVHARRYTAGVGWGRELKIVSTPLFFQRIQAAPDAAGNVIVVYDQQAAHSTAPEAWSVVYDAASTTWSSPARISESGDEGVGADRQTLVASADGRYVALMWLRYSGQFLTYASSWFNRATSSWAAPKPLRGAVPSTTSSGPHEGLPAALDNAGTATFFLPVYTVRPLQSVVAVRGTALRWQAPVRLIAPAQYIASYEDLGNAVAAPDGSVFSAMTVRALNDLMSSFVAFSYTRTKGWTTTVLDTLSGPFPGSSVVLFQKGVIAIYNSGYDSEKYNLRAQVFDGNSWARGPDLPADSIPYPWVATTTNGDANVLLYSESQSTWYRP